MNIGKFSKETGISIDTLRYYNKIGLLEPARVKERRCYTEVDLEKMAAITKLKNLNFSLEEIKALFELEEDIEAEESLTAAGKEKISSCLALIKKKYTCIVKQEQDLQQMKKALERMIDKTNKLLDIGSFYKEGDL